MERIVQKFKGRAQPNCEGAKCKSLMPGDTVNEIAQHKSDQDSRLPLDNVADQDELECSASGNLQAHNGDPDNKELNKDKVSASHSLSHSVLPTQVLAQIEETGDLSNVLKDSNSVKVDCSEPTYPKSGTCTENTESMVKVSVGSQMLVHEHMSVTSEITDITNKPPTSDSQQKICWPKQYCGRTMLWNVWADDFNMWQSRMLTHRRNCDPKLVIIINFSRNSHSRS